jgi:ribosome-associated translation inhibitor RaiA
VKFSISYKNVEWHEPVEMIAEQAAGKLERLLKHYSPDLVQLRGCMEKANGREGYKFSLSLALPTGSLHATGSARAIRPAVRSAFVEIDTQLKKHTSILRGDSQWKRKRRPRHRSAA